MSSKSSEFYTMSIRSPFFTVEVGTQVLQNSLSPTEIFLFVTLLPNATVFVLSIFSSNVWLSLLI